MVLLYSPPPPKPADVVFEETVGDVRGSRSRRVFNVRGASTCVSALAVAPESETSGVQIAGTQAISLNASNVIPMRTVHTSLKKKFRQERMSAFEREYPW